MSDYQQIAELGAQHGKHDLATKAIAEGPPLTGFRSTLLEAISTGPLATPFIN